MPRDRRTSALAAALVLSVLLAACGNSEEGSSTAFVTPQDAVLSAGAAAHLYRSATCACCEDHAAYLESQGFEVVDHIVAEPAQVKHQLGVPDDLRSCHTTVIGGYVVEGHVPSDEIERLLTQRPDVDGIAVPGMPPGSPGMPGELSEPLDVRAFTDGAEVTSNR